MERLFPVRGDFNLYTPEYMEFENKHWIVQKDSWWFGAPDRNYSPGDLDPKRSVLIGDLGIGYDQPIALDY